MNNLKPYKSHIPYTKHQITNEDIKSVEKILKSNFLTTGPQNNYFWKIAEERGQPTPFDCFSKLTKEP